MKQKTRKSVIKKVKITKNKKVLRKHTKQNHFNSKEPGSVTRKKRGYRQLFKTDEENALKNLTH